MKNKKARIDTYETLYHIDIIVANQYVELKELQKLFTYSDGSQLTEDIFDGDGNTSHVYRKSDNKPCVLMKFNHLSGCKSWNKDLDLINVISHEASHIACCIYESISQNLYFCSTEPFCWLVGYATECIYKTLKNK